MEEKELEIMYPNAEWVDLVDVHVPTFQRVGRRNDFQNGNPDNIIRKILANPDPLMFKPIEIAQDPFGKYDVIDGLGRICAAEALGMNRILAYRTFGITQQQAAIQFQSQSQQLSLKPYDFYVSGLVHGDPLYVAIRDIVTKFGFSIQDRNRNQDVNVITTVGTLTTLVRLHGAKCLQDTLDVLNNVTLWRQSPNGKTDKFLRGLNEFLWRYEDKLERAEVIRCFNAVAGNAPLPDPNIRPRFNGATDPQALVDYAGKESRNPYARSAVAQAANVLRFRYNAYAERAVTPKKTRKIKAPYNGF